MNPGEAFELKCYEYLKNNYTSDKVKFFHKGGMDSTISDIAVAKNGLIDFYIEAKDSFAQSGQFVLIPDKETRSFAFSSKNHSKPNETTDIIINYMNKNFDKFSNANTAGEKIYIDKTVFANWIIKYYKEKNVKYVISYKKNFVILPIRKFADYFDISGSYRIKKSGSGKPSKRDVDIIKQNISYVYSSAVFKEENKKLFVELSSPIVKDKFVIGKYTYYLSMKNAGLYEIRKLSNTRNMNVIFSIELIKCQDREDIEEFKQDIYFI